VRAAAEHGEHALLVRPGSPKAIAEAVHALSADPTLGPRLSRQARARIERDFTWARARESLVVAYEEAFGMVRSSTRWSTDASA
jgi:glycosyltransferase involved in cell wall biosynthesis